jgi:hypothetical protein
MRISPLLRATPEQLDGLYKASSELCETLGKLSKEPPAVPEARIWWPALWHLLTGGTVVINGTAIYWWKRRRAT